jgi:hypothetical protein
VDSNNGSQDNDQLSPQITTHLTSNRASTNTNLNVDQDENINNTPATSGNCHKYF